MTNRKTKHFVTVIPADRMAMRDSRLGLDDAEVMSFAAVRAAGRQAFLLSRSVPRAMSAMVSALPPRGVEAWMRDYLKGKRG